MEIVNDNGCSWINDLDPRSNIKVLEKNEECEWLIIGAGYTGLSAARKLRKINPKQKIILNIQRLRTSERDNAEVFLHDFEKPHQS